MANESTGPEFLNCHRGDAVIDALIVLRQQLFAGLAVRDMALGIQNAFRDRSPELAKQMTEMVEHVDVAIRHDSMYSLEHLLEDLALGVRRRPEDERGLKVATLHKTKGLQWEHVFLVGMEDSSLPGRYDNDEELSDERRLLFVGVSRACDRLTLTHVGRISMFVEELQRSGVMRCQGASEAP